MAYARIQFRRNIKIPSSCGLKKKKKISHNILIEKEARHLCFSQKNVCNTIY